MENTVSVPSCVSAACKSPEKKKSFTRKSQQKQKKVVGPCCLRLGLFVTSGSPQRESERDRLGWLSCHKGCSQRERT